MELIDGGDYIYSETPSETSGSSENRSSSRKTVEDTDQQLTIDFQTGGVIATKQMAEDDQQDSPENEEETTFDDDQITIDFDANQDEKPYESETTQKIKQDLGKATLKKRIAYGIAYGIIGLMVSSLVFLGIGLAKSVKASRVFSETGYKEFNEQYLQEQADAVAERVYNQELNPAQYNQEIAKIKDFNRQQYLDTYVDSKTSAEYRQLCESADKSIMTGLSIASVGLVTAIPSTFYGFYQEQKEKRLIRDLKESQRCDKTLNSPTHRDVYKKILEMDVHQK